MSCAGQTQSSHSDQRVADWRWQGGVQGLCVCVCDWGPRLSEIIAFELSAKPIFDTQSRRRRRKNTDKKTEREPHGAEVKRREK